MNVPRFYVGTELELKHSFWIHKNNSTLLERWEALGLAVGAEVVLFDGAQTERLYRIEEITEREAHLVYITDYELKMPGREVYILWPERGTDTDERIISYGIRLGASHFIPIAESDEHASRIDIGIYRQLAIFTLEQTERSDLPIVRDPMTLDTAVAELRGRAHFFANKTDVQPTLLGDTETIALFLGLRTDQIPQDAQRIDGELREQFDSLLSML